MMPKVVYLEKSKGHSHVSSTKYILKEKVVEVFFIFQNECDIFAVLGVDVHCYIWFLSLFSFLGRKKIGIDHMKKHLRLIFMLLSCYLEDQIHFWRPLEMKD